MSSPAASTQPVARRLDEWFELPGWEPAPPAPAGEIGACAVLGDTRSARALAARLCEMGCPTLHLECAPGAAEGHDRALAWIRERPEAARRIVAAWAADPPGPAGMDALLERALHPVLGLGRAAASSGDRRPVQIDVLTAGAYDVDGTERANPALATVLGPTRVLPLELPHLHVRHLDLGAEPHAGGGSLAAVVAELAAAPAPPVVALRGRVRWLPSLRPVELPAAAGERAWRPGGSYLVTGGLGGFGQALAEHLARTARARLALVARTPLPPRERWDTAGVEPGAAAAIAAIRRVEALGGEVALYAEDVTDAAGMRRVRDDLLRRFGRLDGIVHAAGVPGAGLVEARRRADGERVLAPKVAGTLVLSEVFGGLPLDFIVLCSSLTSFVGGVGQADYCAANAFLDAFPSSGLPLADRAVAVNWGGLLGAGMWVPREGDVGMEPAHAMEALRRAIGARVGPRVVILPVPVLEARPWVPGTGRAGPAGPMPRTADELERRLAGLWSEALEAEVPTNGNFFELGGNSLLAVELLWRMADELGVRLPMHLLTEAATPAAVARAILARTGGA